MNGRFQFAGIIMAANAAMNGNAGDSPASSATSWAMPLLLKGHVASCNEAAVLRECANGHF